MDLLRFLLLSPVRLLQGLLYLLGLVLRPVFGKVSWMAPAWATALDGAVRRKPKQFAGAFLALFLLAAGGWYGWDWYTHRPRPAEPERITFDVAAPAPTEYETLPDGTPRTTIHPLRIDFSDSAAPIELVGKVAGKGIRMQPTLEGEWRWTDDRTLVFTPREDWPVGAQVKLRFDTAQAFAPHVLLADDKAEFDLAAFEATLGDGEFYQDPQDRTAKKVIIPVNFNYPVDAAQFEKRLVMTLADKAGKRGTPLKFTVTYDTFKLNAWVHSQPLSLPRDPGVVQLKLQEGVRSARGGSATRKDVEVSVPVPGLYSLAVRSIAPTLVDNDKHEPEQVLVVNVGGAVQGTDLASRVKAWVLPASRPDRQSQQRSSAYSWNVSEVSEAVLRESTPLALELVPTESDYAELQSFKYRPLPGQRVYVRIDAGLKSFGGYELGKPIAQTFTVPDYPQLLRFMAEGSLLSLSGSKRISIVSRNMPGMQMEIGRVLPDQLQHLVSLNEGSYSKPDLGYMFSDDHIVERFRHKQAFAKTEPGKVHYEGIDLGQYLQAGKRGVFMLRLASYDPAAVARRAEARAQARAYAAQGMAAAEGDSAAQAAEDASDEDAYMPSATDTRLVVITDLGMLVKRALDGSQDVFVQSISNGQPVAGASVSVLAVNGQVLYSQSTSDSGKVHFPTFKGLVREKRPVMYVVRKGDDLSFLPIGGYDRQLDYSRFDIGGEPNAINQGQLTSYLFSDRGIYRPGDEFHIGLIVRAASWSRNVAGIPLQAEIVDPRGVTVKQQALTMDASGFGELAYAPAETAPTGTWTVNLHIVRDGRAAMQIGSTTVQVKEFLPDRMKVTANLSEQVAEGWVKPDGLKAVVDVQNLFGTPAADRRVEGSLTLRPAWPSFRSWPDYRFYDVRRAKEGYEESLQDAKTDDKGHAEFSLDLKKYADATYQLYFLGKAYEAEGGRSVAAAAQTLVSSNDWLVGYKAVDSLDYIRRDSPRSVQLVAIDPKAKAMALGELKAQLIERRYVSVLTRQSSGVYKYESRLKEIPVSESPLSIPAAGMDYVLPTDKPGSYALVIRRASDHAEVNRVEYAVAGDANISRSLDRNAELQINLSKQDYAQGEAVEIAIRAPYAGSGLITIERDKVYAHTWFHADTTSSVQHITVPANFEGNGYINVQYVRDPSSDEVFMSPLSYGVVPFSVNLDARRNALAVDTPAVVKPGQTMTMTLRSSQPTRAVVFAVDEGILQVARYKLGDPLKYFFRKRMLEVNTSQILDLILPDFAKLMSMAAPGGDADAAIGRQLNPFKRKRDKPVVYWSGITEVDGEKAFRYTVPDYFNGRIRVMAVSVSGEHIGTVESSTTVRSDFVLSPNVPTTLAPGDQAEISVGVANNLTDLGGKQVPVAVTLKTGPQLQLVGDATQTLSLGEMREGVAVFKVKATDVLGSGNLTFNATYGGKAAKQSVDLSVRPASVYRTQVDVGRVDPHSHQDLPDLRKLYDAYASRDAAISTLPVVLAQGLTTFLVNFQHYCTEQIISAAMPRLVVAKWPIVPVFSKALQPTFSEKKISNDQALTQFLDVLHSRQNSQGGFGVWAATPDSESFISAYAMHFMLEARERGTAVPKDMVEAGNRYLARLASDERVDSLDGLRQRAYAVYLLTRQGNVTTNDLASVQKRLQTAYPNDWKSDLSAAWLAASYKLLWKEKEASELMAGPLKVLERKRGKETYAYSYYYDPLTRDASVLYLLARHFPERAKRLAPEVMENLVWPLVNNRFNTLSSAMTLLALDVYAEQNADELDKLSINAMQGTGGSQAISAIQGNLVQAASWGAGTSRLRFSNGSSLPAWRVASQGGYDRVVSDKVIKDGLEIVREYTDTKGKALGTISTGDEIDVHVKIRATGDKGLGNVAIVDLLPGGFEPVIEPPPPLTDRQSDDEDEYDEGGDSEVSASAWRSPIGLSSSTWQPEYADIREDRVVIYGTATPDVREFVYRIKATSAGTFVVPPAYGESLYDRAVQAQAPGGGTLNVVSKP